MHMWLLGAGNWGSKLLAGLKKCTVPVNVLDPRKGQGIGDITDTAPVIVATPEWQHHEQTVALLKRGHDVYVEKPLAETCEQISDIEACLQPGQLLMVGHLFIHHPHMAEIKAIIDSCAIGDLVHLSSRRLNWGRYQTKTDPLLSLGVHDISIILELTGKQPRVDQAQAWNYSNNIKPDRVYFSGVCGEVSFDCDVSWHWPVTTRHTIILGTAGQILWDQGAGTITVSGNRIQDRRAVADTNPRIINYDNPLSPLELELKHWIDCLNTRQMPKTGLLDAKAVAMVIDRVKQLI